MKRQFLFPLIGFTAKRVLLYLHLSTKNNHKCAGRIDAEPTAGQELLSASRFEVLWAAVSISLVSPCSRGGADGGVVKGPWKIGGFGNYGTVFQRQDQKYGTVIFIWAKPSNPLRGRHCRRGEWRRKPSRGTASFTCLIFDPVGGVLLSLNLCPKPPQIRHIDCRWACA